MQSLLTDQSPPLALNRFCFPRRKIAGKDGKADKNTESRNLPTYNIEHSENPLQFGEMLSLLSQANKS